MLLAIFTLTISQSVDLCILCTYSWAFGVVLWEIMTYGMFKCLATCYVMTCTSLLPPTAAFPFYHLTNREVIASVKDGERLAQPDDCPNDV